MISMGEADKKCLKFSTNQSSQYDKNVYGKPNKHSLYPHQEVKDLKDMAKGMVYLIGAGPGSPDQSP